MRYMLHISVCFPSSLSIFVVKSCSASISQLIGEREKLQDNPIFHGKIYCFRLRFSLKSTRWLLHDLRSSPTGKLLALRPAESGRSSAPTCQLHVTFVQSQLYNIGQCWEYSVVISHMAGWKIPELNGGFDSNIIDKCSIFQQAMLITGGHVIWHMNK